MAKRKSSKTRKTPARIGGKKSTPRKKAPARKAPPAPPVEAAAQAAPAEPTEEVRSDEVKIFDPMDSNGFGPIHRVFVTDLDMPPNKPEHKKIVVEVEVNGDKRAVMNGAPGLLPEAHLEALRNTSVPHEVPIAQESDYYNNKEKAELANPGTEYVVIGGRPHLRAIIHRYSIVDMGVVG